MKYLLILIFISQFLFSAELTRKIMVSSFHSMDDAQYALKIFNENRTTQFDKLQNELNFRRSLNVKNFPSLILKYKKELYPINIKYNDYKSMLEQINDMVENSYF